MEEVLNAIQSDLEQHIQGFSINKQLLYNGKKYFPTDHKGAAAALNSQGELKSGVTLVQHPSVQLNNRPKKHPCFLDMVPSFAAACHRAGNAYMKEQEHILHRDDFCILPELISIGRNSLVIEAINGKYPNVEFAPNWVPDMVIRKGEMSFGGESFGPAQAKDTLRIFASNCPRPIFVGDIGSDCMTIGGRDLEVAFAIDEIGSSRTHMRYYKGMAEEIMLGRLMALWNTMEQYYANRRSAFADAAIKQAFIEDSMNALFPLTEVEASAPLLVFE